MGQALPKIGLRPYLPADASVLASIFAASINVLTEDDYSEAQREAWASAAEDEGKFAKRLAGQLTLVATIQSSPVGFISLKDNTHIDLLYVHPSAARQGVATTLVDAIEKLSTARGANALTADVSDTAQHFFARRGYEGQQRSTISVGDEWLATTTMKKTFNATALPGDPSKLS